jgi:hypothetical protein
MRDEVHLMVQVCQHLEDTEQTNYRVRLLENVSI